MNNSSTYGSGFALQEGNKTDEAPQPCVSANDDDYLLQKEKHLTSHYAEKWRKAALSVSFVSLVCTFVIGVTAFSISSVSKSSAAFGFAFDSLLDFITTLIVVWRYFGDRGELYDWDRERRACIIIGVCFIVSAVGIFVRAVRALVVERLPHEFVGVQIIAGVCLVVYSILTWLKIVVADRISSSSLKTDGYNSLAGAVMALGILMSSLAYEHNKSVWFLDASIALCISVAIGVYGIRLLSQMTSSKIPTNPLDD